MAFTPVILAALVVVFTTISASPIQKRETECREEGLFVGGTVVGDAYIENVETEEDCIEKCKALEKCNAVNYFPKHKACLPQEETFQGENKESLASDKFEHTVYVIVNGCGTLGGRRKRDASCKLENLFVGGTPATADKENPYIMDVKSEDDCIEECNKIEECNAVNYFPEQEACLPQIESLAKPEEQESVAAREEKGTVYIAVKDCSGGLQMPPNVLPPALPEEPKPEPEEPEQEKRRKREANCKLEDVLVGGEVAGKGYIEEVATEEACVEACKSLDDCNAVNYWPELGDCLPQIQTLADPDFHDRLSSREEKGTNYIVVKGCNGDIERPANILPPVESGESDEASEENKSEEGSEQRKKRDVECRKEKLLVGGELVGDQIDDVESEEDCVAKCKDLDECTAVNYFPEHKVCWAQKQSVLSDTDLPTREEELTNYVIVKGCGEQ